MDEKTRKNVTKYGEFVPTFFAWTGLDRQKKIVQRLENSGKEEEK